MISKPINLRRRRHKDSNIPVIVIKKGKHTKYGILRFTIYKSGIKHTGAELGTYVGFFFYRNSLHMALYSEETPNTLRFTGRKTDPFISCQSLQLAKEDIKQGEYLIGEPDSHEDYPNAVIFKLSLIPK